MTSILFVCTGNIFRSMTADFALNKLLSSNSQFIVSSAGTRNQPELMVRSDVAAYLQSKGLNVSNHRRRTVDQEIMDGSDIVIAMHEDHQQLLAQRFGRQCPLFTEACGNAPTPLPDVDDLFANGDYFTPAAIRHVKSTIDTIVELSPSLLKQLQTNQI